MTTILVWGQSPFVKRVAHYIQTYGEFRDLKPRFAVFEDRPDDMDVITKALHSEYTNESGTSRPEYVINAWESPSITACENDPTRAFADNTRTAARLALACRGAGVKLIHISTVHVFGRTSTKRIDVDERPRPSSVYGMAKWQAERAVMSMNPDATIIRYNPWFSPGGWPEGIRDVPGQSAYTIEAAEDIGSVPQFEGEAAFLLVRNLLESPILLTSGIVHCASAIDPESYWQYLKDRANVTVKPFTYNDARGALPSGRPSLGVVALEPTKGWHLSNDPKKHWSEHLSERESGKYIEYF